MTKEIIIICLIVALIYLYYQNKKLTGLPANSTQTIFATEESEEVRDLKTQLSQALEIQRANERKLNELNSAGAGTSTYNPDLKELENERDELTKDLNSILDKWNWGEWKPTNASEFINKFEPWINQHLEQEKEIKEFLKDKGDNLSAVDQKLTNLAQTNSELKKDIERLKSERETAEELETLEAERDEAIREQKLSEQELVSASNRLKLKNQEVGNKDKQIEKLKKEKSEVEIRLNQSLTELRTKYSKQGALLDGEQTDNNKLTKQIENLEEKIKELQQQQFRDTEKIGESEEEKEEITSLADFIKWVQDYEEFAKVDWDYYRKQEDWEMAFRKWNALRADRLELLEQWKEATTDD